MQGKMTNLDYDKQNEDARKELSAQKFGEEIQRLRLRADLSQDELGVLTGDKQGVISRIEKAKYGVTLDLVFRLAVALHDDPYRLASIYWDSYSTEYVDGSKEILNAIWDLLSRHYLHTSDFEGKIPRQPLPFSPNQQAKDIVPEMDQQVKEENPKKPPQETDIPEEQELN
jgi:transcriptional regulator with XRE-family HTH domain